MLRRLTESPVLLRLCFAKICFHKICVRVTVEARLPVCVRPDADLCFHSEISFISGLIHAHCCFGTLSHYVHYSKHRNSGFIACKTKLFFLLHYRV